MKLYFYFSILVFVAIIGGLYFYQTKKTDNAVIISPLVKDDSPKASAFSIETAPSQSLKGKITAMSGKIEWQSRIATQASEIFTPITIQQGEKLISGEKSNLSLVFESAVSIDFLAETEIEIVQTLPKNIVFSQISGTASYIKTGNYPVSVRIRSLLLETDGDMSVSIDPENPIITMDLKSGKAKAAYNDIDFVSHVITIDEGDTLTFNYGNRRAVLR